MDEKTLRTNVEEVFNKREKEVRSLKDIVKNLYAVVVRTLVVLKYLVRAGAVVGAFFWLGKPVAIALAGFIAVTACVQWGVDKARQAVNPDLKLSEWDIDL